MCCRLIVHLLLVLVLIFVSCEISHSASDKIPHSHRGLIPPFSGKQISYTITKRESDLLDAGVPVVHSDKATGRGLVIQDVDAPPALAMKTIMDMQNYDKYVAQVKKIHIYSEKTLPNGTMLYGARFDTAALGMGFRYWLALRYEPKYDTFTWTLDYNYNSDFDDNVGHWQVMEHPTKKGWTRVLYSCQLRLFAWIPDFIVKYLIKTALVESTTWVTKYSQIGTENTHIHMIYGTHVHVHTCIHTHTFIHSFIHSFIHTYIHRGCKAFIGGTGQLQEDIRRTWVLCEGWSRV